MDQLSKAVCGQEQTSRLARMDCFRLVAALAVIWIHVPHNGELRWTTIFCRFAVPFFAAGLAYFAILSGMKPSASLRNYLVSRTTKLYIPFLFWTAVYLGFKTFKRFVVPEQHYDLPGIEVLWTGGAYHLWFVPFAMLTSILGFAVGRFLTRCSDTQRLITACCLIVLSGLIANLVWPICANMAEPWRYMIDATPAAIAGSAAAILVQIRNKSWMFEPGRPSNSFAGIVFFVSIALLVWDGRNIVLETVVGCSCLAFALSTTFTRLETRFAPFGQYAMGLYFVHLLFIKVFETAGSKFHWHMGWSVDLLVFALTVVLSGFTVWLLRKHRLTNWTVA